MQVKYYSNEPRNFDKTDQLSVLRNAHKNAPSDFLRIDHEIAQPNVPLNLHEKNRSNNISGESQSKATQNTPERNRSNNIHIEIQEDDSQNFHKKSFLNISQSIHNKALVVAGRYKKSEIELIDILEQVDRHKVYYKYGYRSMFQYVNEGLGLSHEVTSIFINVARKAREVPALKQEIKKGTITVSKARRITSVLNQNNKDHWLTLAKSSSKRVLEKEVAASSPKEAVREKMAYVHPNNEVTDQVRIMNLQKDHNVKPQVRVQLQVGVSEKLMLQLRRVQELVSQKQQKPARLENCLELMAELYIKKHDPVERAKRQKTRGRLNDKNSLCPGTTNKSRELPENDDMHTSSLGTKSNDKSRRKPLPAKTRHQLVLKYQGQCSYINENGKRCSERKFLDIHHKIPLFQGGSDEIENLVLLCTGHHKFHHFVSES